MDTPSSLFQRAAAENAAADDFAHFEVRGRRLSIFRRLIGGKRTETYYLKMKVNGKQVYQSTGEVTKARAVEVAKLKANAVLDQRWDALRETRLRQPRPVSLIEDLLEAYEKLALSCVENLTMRAGTPRRNANALRVMLRRVLKRDELKGVSARALEQKDLIAEYIRLHVKEAGEDRVARDSRIRGACSTVIQARSVFSKAALNHCYGRYVLPDLTAFLGASLPDRKDPPKEGLIDAAVAEMAQAALPLKTSDRQLYIVHLLFRHLALRNDEVENARVEWLEPRKETVVLRTGEKREIAGVLRVITRPYWEPKAGVGEVPISPCVWAELQTLTKGFEPLDHIVKAAHLTERSIAVDRRHGDFVRPWTAKFRKQSYELRRWGQTLIKRREGDEMAARFVRHAESTTGGRFYDTGSILPAPITLADCGLKSAIRSRRTRTPPVPYSQESSR